MQHDPHLYLSTIELPIHWGDMDAFNHVNNTVHLRWFESSRIRYIEQSGVHRLLQQHQVRPILASLQCNYKRQLHYPNQVIVGSRVSLVKRSSFTMDHVVWNKTTGEVAADGHSTVVVFDFDRQRPKRVPDDIKLAVERFEKKNE